MWASSPIVLIHCFVSGRRILPFIISPLLLVLETDWEDDDETSNGCGVLLVLVALLLLAEVSAVVNDTDDELVGKNSKSSFSNSSTSSNVLRMNSSRDKPSSSLLSLVVAPSFITSKGDAVMILFIEDMKNDEGSNNCGLPPTFPLPLEAVG